MNLHLSVERVTAEELIRYIRAGIAACDCSDSHEQKDNPKSHGRLFEVRRNNPFARLLRLLEKPFP